MDFRITRSDCNKISYTIADNGLMEISAPQDSKDTDINTFLSALGQEEFEGIADRQKKLKEKFRKKTHEQIKRYADEFEIPFLIDLQLRNKTKKLNDFHVDVHGICFEGKMQLVAILQYFPEDVVDKIVRYSVYGVAIDYENVCSRIKGIKVSTFQFPDIENAKEKHYGTPYEAKYRISMPYDQIKKIQADYEKAVIKFGDIIEASPIISI